LRKFFGVEPNKWAASADVSGAENKNANLHGLAFCCTAEFLVARGGIEPPTQGFSKQDSAACVKT
jgi:hypothetical protein